MDRLVTPEPESSQIVDGHEHSTPESSSPVSGIVIVKEGWLQGRCPTLGKENASLKRRFFVLEPTRMIWYDYDESRRSSDLPSAPVGEMSLNPETHIFTDSLAKGQLCVQGFCRTLVGESGEALVRDASGQHPPLVRACPLEQQTKGKLVLKSASPQEARDWASMLAAQVDSQTASDAERTRSTPQSSSKPPPPDVGASPRMPPQFTGWEKFSARASDQSACMTAESPPGASLDDDRLSLVAEAAPLRRDRSAPELPRSTEELLSPRARHQAVHRANPTPAAASEPLFHDAGHSDRLGPGATRESGRARASTWSKAREALDANCLPERSVTLRSQAAVLGDEARAVLEGATALDNEALFLLSEMLGRLTLAR